VSTQEHVRVPVAVDGRVGPVPRGRSLVSYLILPRPQELVAKALFFLVAPLGVALATGPTSKPGIGDAIAFVFALEVLVYQARYQWNDIRGFAEDQRHPAAAERGRLPGPPTRARRQIALSAFTVAVRLALAVGIGVLLGKALGIALLVAGFGIWGVAIVYEALRHRISADNGGSPLGLTRTKQALFVVVGLGYAVRAVSGLWVGSGATIPLAGVVTATITMSAIGTIFVTMSWVLEGSSCVGEDVDGRLIRSPLLAGKGHLASLLTAVGIPSDVPEGPVLVSMSGTALLRRRQTLRAPWNLGLLAAGVAGSYGSISLAWHMTLPTARVGAVGCAVGLVAALGAALAPWWASAFIGSALAAFLWVLAAGHHPSRPWMAVVMPSLVFVVYTAFRRTTYDAINASARPVTAPMTVAVRRELTPAAGPAAPDPGKRLTQAFDRGLRTLVPPGAPRRFAWGAVALLVGQETTALLRRP
jgi:hypothetical protein